MLKICNFLKYRLKPITKKKSSWSFNVVNPNAKPFSPLPHPVFLALRKLKSKEPPVSGLKSRKGFNEQTWELYCLQLCFCGLCEFLHIINMIASRLRTFVPYATAAAVVFSTSYACYSRHSSRGKFFRLWDVFRVFTLQFLILSCRLIGFSVLWMAG